MSKKNFQYLNPRQEQTNPEPCVDILSNIDSIAHMITVGLAPWPSHLPEPVAQELIKAIRKERQHRFLRLVAKAIALDLAESVVVEAKEISFDTE